MDTIETASRLSWWALEFLCLPPFLILVLVAACSLAWAAWKRKPFRHGLWKPGYWLMLTHLGFFALAIAMAMFLAAPPHPSAGNRRRFAGYALEAVMYSSFASCTYWTWRMKGIRWFAASLLMLLEAPVLGAVFVAGMAITGQWL